MKTNMSVVFNIDNHSTTGAIHQVKLFRPDVDNNISRQTMKSAGALLLKIVKFIISMLAVNFGPLVLALDKPTNFFSF